MAQNSEDWAQNIGEELPGPPISGGVNLAQIFVNPKLYLTIYFRFVGLLIDNFTGQVRAFLCCVKNTFEEKLVFCMNLVIVIVFINVWESSEKWRQV